MEGSLNRIALVATLHCLSGCATSEILGMVIATALGWGKRGFDRTRGRARVLLRLLVRVPLVRGGVDTRSAVGTAFASDTISITIMEIVDNAFILIVPGAIAAGLTDSLFWWSLLVGLFLAFWAAFPANRWLIGQGSGCAHAHQAHSDLQKA